MNSSNVTVHLPLLDTEWFQVRRIASLTEFLQRLGQLLGVLLSFRQFQLDTHHVLVGFTLNRDDRTLTGNVFFPDGRAPAFVSCGQNFGNLNAFRCSGAGPCETAGCTDQYDLLATVELPDDFFGSQTCGNLRVESSERCEADTFCFVLCGVDALCMIDLGVAPVPVAGVCADDCTRCVPIS